MKNDLLKQFIALTSNLRKEKAELEARLAELNRVLQYENSGSPASGPVNAVGKRKMSAAGRARIIAAQRKRWAAFRATHGSGSSRGKSPKAAISTAGRARIAAAQKKRWAAFRAAKS